MVPVRPTVREESVPVTETSPTSAVDVAPAIVIDDATVRVFDPAESRAALPRRRKPSSWLIGGIAGGVLLVVVVATVWLATRATPPTARVDVSASYSANRRVKTPPRQILPRQRARVTRPPAPCQHQLPAARSTTTVETLWVSPTAGEPLSLRYLPSVRR